jgi:hypothetical protein
VFLSSFTITLESVRVSCSDPADLSKSVTGGADDTAESWAGLERKISVPLTDTEDGRGFKVFLSFREYLQDKVCTVIITQVTPVCYGSKIKQ